jgi:hypothetical protein
MRRFVTTLVLAIAATGASILAPPAAAQKTPKPIPRPTLRDVTDTNDAQAYYDFGLRTFRDDPGTAADAFYWAARLNPGWADPLYARRAAVLSSKQTLLNAIMTNNRRNRPELRNLDSLLARPPARLLRDARRRGWPCRSRYHRRRHPAPEESSSCDDGLIDGGDHMYTSQEQQVAQAIARWAADLSKSR